MAEWGRLGPLFVAEHEGLTLVVARGTPGYFFRVFNLTAESLLAGNDGLSSLDTAKQTAEGVAREFSDRAVR
jgi:hypothetical protein